MTRRLIPLLFVLSPAYGITLQSSESSHVTLNSELHAAVLGQTYPDSAGMPMRNASHWRVGLNAQYQFNAPIRLESGVRLEWNAEQVETEQLFAGLSYGNATLRYGIQDGALVNVTKVLEQLLTPNAAVNAQYINLAGDEAANILSYQHRLSRAYVDIENNASYRADDNQHGIAISSKWQLERLNFALGFSQDAIHIEGESVTQSRQGIMAARLQVDEVVQIAGLVNYLDAQQAELFGHDLQVQFSIDNTVFSMNYGTTALESGAHSGKKTTYVSEIAHAFRPSLQGYVSYTLDVSDEHTRQNLRLGDQLQLGVNYRL